MKPLRCLHILEVIVGFNDGDNYNQLVDFFAETILILKEICFGQNILLTFWTQVTMEAFLARVKQEDDVLTSEQYDIALGN